jgi:phosphate transport system substrate-binding protein
MKIAMMLAALAWAALPAWAAPPPLERTNPLGHQTLSVEDYLRFSPSPAPLSGSFVPAYSGTSELFLAGVLRQLAALHPGVAWDRERRFDSSSGVVAMMLHGQADLGISSIPMTSAQREEFTRRFGYPLLEARIALDALQILVHPDNPVDHLTVPQLDALYGSELRAGAPHLLRTWDAAGAGTWGAGKDIHAYAGWLHYGTSKFFRESVLEDGPWRDDLRTLPVVQRPEEAIAADPQAIAFSNYRPRDARVKVLAIARQTEEPPYPPLPAHIYGEEYPLVRFFHVYVNAPDVEDLPAETREFLNFLLSYEGQTEVARTGSLPLDRAMLLRARKRLGL